MKQLAIIQILKKRASMILKYLSLYDLRNLKPLEQETIFHMIFFSFFKLTFYIINVIFFIHHDVRHLYNNDILFSKNDEKAGKTRPV